MTWIQTYTGRQYWPLEPRAQDVHLDDIAHHLSLLCRFTGACKRFYSVAEHSTHASHVAELAGLSNHMVLATLMHDSAEAYCNDIAQPVKRAIVGYTEIEAANEAAIWEALALPHVGDEAWAIIKEIDNAVLIAEQESLMGPVPADWAVMNAPEHLTDAARYRLRLAYDHGLGGAWRPDDAERVFKARYQELRGL